MISIKKYLIFTLFFISSINGGLYKFNPASKPATTNLPVVSDNNPQFKAFDAALLNFMATKGFNAGVAAVNIDKKTVHKVGIGWNDAEKTQPISPDVRMRIASITKGITNIALYKLMHADNPSFTKDTKFWDYLNTPWPKFMYVSGRQIPTPTPKYAYPKIWENGMPEPLDPRAKNITIGQLMEHKGGWDINMLGWDPQFNIDATKQELKLNREPNTDDIIRFMLTKQNLQFTPGERSAYSNFGYNILGRVIEKATGQNYIDAIKRLVFQPLGLPGIDLGYTGKRLPNEIWYSNPDSGYLIEDMDSHGGLVSSAADLARVFDNYWTNGEPRGANENRSSYFLGSLPTTQAVMYQAKNVTVVILLNSRNNTVVTNDDLYELLAIIKRTIPIK